MIYTAEPKQSDEQNAVNLPPWIASFAAMHKRLCELEHQSRLLREEILNIRRSLDAKANDAYRPT